MRDFKREDAARVVTDVVLQYGASVFDVLVVTEARGWLDEDGHENQDVIEYVVQGWDELLAMSSEESDPDSNADGSEESDPDTNADDSED